MDDFAGSSQSFATPDSGRSAGSLVALLDALDVVVWEADAVSGRLTYVNRGVERLFGYAPTDWLTP